MSLGIQNPFPLIIMHNADNVLILPRRAGCQYLFTEVSHKGRVKVWAGRHLLNPFYHTLGKSRAASTCAVADGLFSVLSPSLSPPIPLSPSPPSPSLPSLPPLIIIVLTIEIRKHVSQADFKLSL